MKVLIINKFLYSRGGDATSALSTARLLSARGHEVILWGMHNHQNPPNRYEDTYVKESDLDKKGIGIRDKVLIARNILYSLEAKKKMEKLIGMVRPDIVHLHNFAHQISPSILHVFRKYNIPVVMTMHDYKLVCASYRMLSRGKPCERCAHGRYYHCFTARCVKNSALKSMLNTLEMYLHHDILHIYDLIDIFIAPSLFMKDEIKKMGFRGKVVHLPYFIDTEKYKPSFSDTRDVTILYAGRLSYEKGLFSLLQAMERLPDTKLLIIGEGPMKKALQEKAAKRDIKNVVFQGARSRDGVMDSIRSSAFTVVPSEWYENLPYVIIESFALGKPVVASRIGGIPELVIDGSTGMLFNAGDIDGLVSKIRLMFSGNNILSEMGKNARSMISRKCDPDMHYKSLINIYDTAIKPKSHTKNTKGMMR